MKMMSKFLFVFMVTLLSISVSYASTQIEVAAPHTERSKAETPVKQVKSATKATTKVVEKTAENDVSACCRRWCEGIIGTDSGGNPIFIRYCCEQCPHV